MSGMWQHKHAGNRKIYMKRILPGHRKSRRPIKIQTKTALLFFLRITTVII